MTDGDPAPEGIKAFLMDGEYDLAIAHETSNTPSLYRLSMASVPEPESYAMLLAEPGFGWLHGTLLFFEQV